MKAKELGGLMAIIPGDSGVQVLADTGPAFRITEEADDRVTEDGFDRVTET